MAGPWEQYATEESGPWSKYGAIDPASAEGLRAADQRTDPGPMYPKVESVDTSLSARAGRAITNIPRSAKDFVVNTAQAVIHPIDTATALAQTGAGFVEKALPDFLLPAGRVNEPKADALIQFAEDRYGSADKILNTLETDPVGAAADAATVLTGGGAALTKAGVLPKIAKTMAAAGNIIDPAQITAKAVAPVSSFVANKGAQLTDQLLGMTTGAGAEAIRQARQGSTGFTQGIRGKFTGEELAEESRNAVTAMRDERGKQYRSALAEIEAQNMHTPPLTAESKVAMLDGKTVNPQEITKQLGFVNKRLDDAAASAVPDYNAMAQSLKESGAHPSVYQQIDKYDNAVNDRITKAYTNKISADLPTINKTDDIAGLQAEKTRLEDSLTKLEPATIPKQLDITPVKELWNEYQSRYGVRYDKDGNLDLSRSTLSNKEAADIQEISSLMNNWGKEANDLSPLGLDLLKRKLDNLYTESKDSRAIVTGLRNEVKKKIVQEVPEYAAMTKNYEEATGLIKEIDRALSTSNKAMMDTNLRKLVSTMKENFDFRKDLLTQLDNYTNGNDLTQKIAGYTMNQMIPKGLVGKVVGIGAGGGMMTGVTPGLVAIAAISSPRLVGGLLNAAGWISNQISPVVSQLTRTLKQNPAITRTLFQAGRAARETEQ